MRWMRYYDDAGGGGEYALRDRLALDDGGGSGLGMGYGMAWESEWHNVVFMQEPTIRE